jgi:trk system potassium uptake protein TrkA
LAESLSTDQHNICLIDAKESLADELRERLDAQVICANGASASVLAEANVVDADLFLRLTSDDNANLVAASLARSLGAKKTVARVHSRLQREEWLFDYRGQFNIDYLFSTQRLAAVELAKHVRNPEGLLVEEIARGRIEVQQTQVAANSSLVGQPLKKLGLPPRVRIGFIHREDRHFIPSGAEALLPDDWVTVFGEPTLVADLMPRLRAGEDPDRELKIVIFGGGEYGFALAQMLENPRYRVRIVERSERICREISSVLQRTVVIRGDATSVQQLKEEQVGEVDFFIAASPDDEDNVMSCLQAKSLGARYCLTVIHRSDYAEVVTQNREQLRIHAAVSPRIATSRDLLRFVTTDRYNTIMRLAGDVDVLEMVVDPHGSLAGKKVAEVAWPEGSGLVALLHGSEAVVPTGEDILAEGDTIYAIVSPAARKSFIRLLKD